MAFLRSLRQNLLILQDIFRKRRRSVSAGSSSSRRGESSGRDNSENNPVRNQPDSCRASIQDIQHVQTSSYNAEDASNKAHRSPSNLGEASSQPERSTYTTVDKRAREELAEPERRPQVGVKSAGGKPSKTPASSPSYDGPESDSEVEEKGVARCQCSRNSPFSRTAEVHGLVQAATLADEIYGESDTGNDRNSRHSSKDRSVPSTSRGSAGGHTDTGHSSCSVEDQLMEEMVSTLKTRGSLSRRRSRSRSRRSRPRQNYENGIVVVNNVRVVHTMPRRETDSDESNTSLHDLPLNFRRSFPGAAGSPLQQTSASHSNVQSDSSFHSAAGSDDLVSPQPSPVKEEEEDEWAGADEEAEEWGWVGGEVNSTEHNRSRTGDDSSAGGASGGGGGGGGGSGGGGGAGVRQMEELSTYGPEEFVLDLFLAMCRGTWSDIL